MNIIARDLRLAGNRLQLLGEPTFVFGDTILEGKFSILWYLITITYLEKREKALTKKIKLGNKFIF